MEANGSGGGYVLLKIWGNTGTSWLPVVGSAFAEVRIEIFEIM
jgi:hypothetical protein